MASTTFKTVLAAHDAFYKALGDADIELMTQVWSPTEEAVCIHPLWPPLIGQPTIVASWADMFNSDSTMTVNTQILNQRHLPDSCIQLVSETLGAPGRPTSPPVLATNIYERAGDGWLMVLHHASPTAEFETAEHDDHPLH